MAAPSCSEACIADRRRTELNKTRMSRCAAETGLAAVTKSPRNVGADLDGFYERMFS